MKDNKNKISINLLAYKVANRFLPKIYNLLIGLNKRILYKKRLLEFKLKPGDIFISTYMKSGTTWLQMILYQLTSDGEMNFEHIYDKSPWIDKDFENGKQIIELDPPRFFKTHLNYNCFPKRFDAKFICVIRNGMDVAVSQYHQLLDFRVPVSFDQSFKNYFLNKNKSKNWFYYTRNWLANKKEYNILYIRYEDLKNDFQGTLYKIADFCNIEMKEENLPRIIESCSFEYMKKYEEKFIPERNGYKPGDFIRKGKSGQGKKMFSKELTMLYKNEFDKHLSKFEILRDYYPAD